MLKPSSNKDVLHFDRNSTKPLSTFSFFQHVAPGIGNYELDPQHPLHMDCIPLSYATPNIVRGENEMSTKTSIVQFGNWKVMAAPMYIKNDVEIANLF